MGGIHHPVPNTAEHSRSSIPPLPPLVLLRIPAPRHLHDLCAPQNTRNLSRPVRKGFTCSGVRTRDRLDRKATPNQPAEEAPHSIRKSGRLFAPGGSTTTKRQRRQREITGLATSLFFIFQLQHLLILTQDAS